MTNFPAPTDDELILFTIDERPSSAMRDYLRRNIIGPETVDFEELREFFKAEFNRRMS
jgi:hypothetical protein